MKNLFIASLVLALGALIAVSAEASIPVYSAAAMFQPLDTTTVFKISDYETAYNSSGQALAPGQTITVGDTLSGIYNITSSQTPGGSNVLSPTGFQLSGLFSATVSAVTTNVDSSGDSAFVLVPNPNFVSTVSSITGIPTSDPRLASIPAGSMVTIFDGPANQFTADSTLAGAYNSVLSGATLWQAMGASGTWGTGYYWGAVGAPQPGVASFATSLALLYNNAALTGVPTNLYANNLTQQPPASFVPTVNFQSILNAVALQGNTAINTDPGSTAVFQISSQDPLQEEVLPEPSSILILGGLFSVFGGLVAYRVRKVNP